MGNHYVVPILLVVMPDKLPSMVINDMNFWLLIGWIPLVANDSLLLKLLEDHYDQGDGNKFCLA